MTDKKIYDFVIIGSGIGGLASAVILAKNGHSVLVLEKNHQVGGVLQVFSRDKRIFDTGVHYMGGLDIGENLYQLFQYLEIMDTLKLKPMNPTGFDTFRFPDGQIYKHGQGYDNFISQLVSSFPAEKKAILAFCEKMKEVCDFFPFYNLDVEINEAYYEHPEILSLGAWDFVSSITNNERLKAVFLASGPLYAGDAKTTPFYVVALILNSYIKGSYRPIDGGAQIAKALIKVIRKYGGEIQKRKEVVGATFWEDKKINEVLCSDGTSYTGLNYISNVHPAVSIDIFGKERFRRPYRERVQGLENTISSFMVYVSLKEKSFPYLDYNVYEYYTDDIWNIVDYEKETWPQIIFINTPATSKSSEYADSLSIMCYMKTEEVEAWIETYNTVAKPQNRGAAYAAFKKEKEELVLSKLAERYPTIKDSILQVYSSTPLTYKDYIGSGDGSLYGIMKDFNKPLETMINTKTKISNLFFTGQNVVFHGILGATISAFVSCFHFVGYQKIVNEIKKK